MCALRIVAVSGIRSRNNPIWRHFFAAFKEFLPHGCMEIEEEPMCEFYHIGRFRRFAGRLVERYDDGRQTLFVGHSMGGLISCKVVSELQITPVVGVITVFTPHQHWPFARLLQVPKNPGVPTISFEAERDHLVPWGTRHPLSSLHTKISSRHLRGIADDPRIARSIVETSLCELCLKPECAY